jgi:hypothetical protein
MICRCRNRGTDAHSYRGFVAGPSVLSLWWVAAVALIPETSRTYIDGSTTNSPWQTRVRLIASLVGAGGIALVLPAGECVGDAGEWRLSTEPERLAASYTMHAIKA